MGRILGFFLSFYEIYKNMKRNEGLVWLIKKCLSNGEKIDENNLPDFLDTKAKEFLLQVNFPKLKFNFFIL